MIGIGVRHLHPVKGGSLSSRLCVEEGEGGTKAEPYTLPVLADWPRGGTAPRLAEWASDGCCKAAENLN